VDTEQRWRFRRCDGVLRPSGHFPQKRDINYGDELFASAPDISNLDVNANTL
jgi:hypothetical protein